MVEKQFYGERLKSARMFRGLTLTELAKRTEISKQSLSLYENDNNKPDHMKVRILASELDFPYDYFFQKDSYVAKTETIYFRSLASATKKDRTAQSIRLEYVAKIYEILLEYISFPEMNLPSVDFEGYDDVFECESEASVQEIENIAVQVRQDWDIGTGAIKDLQYLLEKNGIIVTGFDTNEDKIDGFSQRTIVGGNDIYFIAVALGSRPEGRIRFDMAHELGHILLHPWSEDLEAITKDEFKARERQANMFASAFLLPCSSFGKDVSSYPTDLQYYQFLKKKWKVSIQAMIYRTHQLKIISDNQYQYLMRQVSKNGWRQKEPDDVPYTLNESIFQGAVDLLIDQRVLTAKQILELLKRNGVALYSHDIEELLHLRQDTLKVEEKVIPILQLRKKQQKDDNQTQLLLRD